eukprot:Em0019g798a
MTTLHAQGVFPGNVPITWLEENDLFICRYCFQLVSNSRLSTHSKKCVGGAAVVRGSEDTSMPVDNPPVEALPFHQPDPSLPTFEEGRHDKPLPVDALCNMWIDNDLGSLWNLAKGRAISLIHQSTSSIRQRTNNIDMAISLGRSGMFGKACRILQSSGIAPNNENTWQLLKAKHPSCPAPVVPVVQYTETITLQPDFNILSVLQSFPKDTAAGPSGLRVQHLLDVARSVINMLAAGRAPSSVSRFLAGGSLIALNKNKEGCAPDIRPIAMGETLRRLVGKCMCALLKVKATDFFQPLQFGVACRAGAEKVTHGLRICIEEHWHGTLDDGALAGNRPAVLRAMHIIEEMGPALGLYINFTKCELFSSKSNASFPPAVKCSLLPNLDILGAPVGDYLHCSRFIADKCAESKKLLTSLVDVAGVDLQVAFTLLRMCGGFCKLVHLTWVTPPSLASDALVSFDEDAQLSLRFGGLGLSCHATAAYIASLSLSGLGQSNNHHLQQAVIAYNSKVASHHAITAESALASPTTQRELSSKIDEDQFKSLLGASCPADKPRLLSVSAPHSSSWVSVIPSMGLGLHMEYNEFQTAVRWWLGVGVGRTVCPFCQDVALDPLGHHAVTCRHGGDVVIRHNHLRDVF